MSNDPSLSQRRRWSWPRFAMALGLLPVSFVLWLIGLDDAFRPQHNPIAGLCLIVAPFVGLAGVIWMAVLVIRRVTSGRRSSEVAMDDATPAVLSTKKSP